MGSLIVIPNYLVRNTNSYVVGLCFRRFLTISEDFTPWPTKLYNIETTLMGGKWLSQGLYVVLHLITINRLFIVLYNYGFSICMCVGSESWNTTIQLLYYHRKIFKGKSIVFTLMCENLKLKTNENFYIRPFVL